MVTHGRPTVPDSEPGGVTNALCNISHVSIMYICPHCKLECNCNLHSSPSSTGLKNSNPLQEKQLQDPGLKKHFDYLEQGLVPDDVRAARRLAAERSLFEIVDGTLFRAESDGTLKVIPPLHRRKQLVADLHGGLTGAHLRAKKTLGHVKTHYWWESVR